MLDTNDDIFEEQIRRELDLRATGAIDNAPDVLGAPLLTVDDDLGAEEA